LGKGRWFWLLHRSWEKTYHGDTPLATGCVATAQDAEQAVRIIAPNAKYYGASMASHHHRDLCNKRRAAMPPSKHPGATVQEFLYLDGEWDDYGNEPTSYAHLIVKKTKKLVFVEKDRYNPDPWDRKTYALHRAPLEATGSVWSRSARDRFHTTPYEQRRQQCVPPEFAVLELQAGSSKEDVKTAYRRLVRQHHPDCGGDPVKFKEIQAAYEQVMKR